MNLEEIKKYLEENKESKDVVDFMKSIQQPITRDTVEAWCQDGEGRSWLDRNCDIYATKAVNTARENAIAKFKQEELPKIIDDAIKAKSNEGLTPDQMKIKELESKLAETEKLQEKLSQYQRMEQTLTKAIYMTQKTTDQMRAMAYQERDTILEEAKNNANRIVNESLVKAEKAEEEANTLKRNLGIYKKRIRSIIEAQLEVIDELDKVDF